MLIRPLDPSADLAAVADLYRRAADFWQLTDRRLPDLAKARAFFTDTPPGCDPAASHRLGLFRDDLLIGVAELSIGWPGPGDPFLGLQLLAPEARGQGLGTAFLAEIEARARATGARSLYLAVLQENTRGRAFWERHGFRPTGVSRHDPDTGHTTHRLMKPL
jgi:GNAT superfamily N-acetyltransferase